MASMNFLRAKYNWFLLIASSLAFGVLANWLWYEWFLVALIVYGLYFLGACRFFPFKTVAQKSFSLGVFFGSLIGSSVYLFHWF
jgi:hypothetical protein